MKNVSSNEKISKPFEVYKNPEEVLLDQSLTIENKLELVKNWKDYFAQKSAAASEGMPNEAESDGLLTAISHVERKLKEML